MSEEQRGKSDYKWGYHIEDLDRAIEETRKIFVSVARRRSRITYTELCRSIQSVRVDPHSHALAHILGRVSASEDSRGRGMLSVLVGYSSGDTRPGPRLFQPRERSRL